jgi:hypothetical protein
MPDKQSLQFLSTEMKKEVRLQIDVVCLESDVICERARMNYMSS